MPSNTVKVDRTTRWGNPFQEQGNGVPLSRAQAVSLFTDLIDQEGGFTARVRGQTIYSGIADIRRELRSKNLACWCPLDGPCHAAVLLRIANQP